MLNNPLNLDTQDRDCNRAPCGEVGDVKAEVAKIAKLLNDSATSIISEVEAIPRPDLSGFFSNLETILKDYPAFSGEGIDKVGIGSLDDLSRTLGLPNNNDKERLACLGIGDIASVAWKVDESNNLAYYRTLYLALGRDFNKFLSCLTGAFGNWFVVYTKPILVKLISTSSRHLTLDEIIKELGYSVPREDVLQSTDSFGQQISFIYKEDFLGLNKPIQTVADSSGLTKEQIVVKIFNLGTPFSNYDLIRFRSFGLSEQMIGWTQVAQDKSEMSSKLGAVSSYLTPAISEANLTNAKDAILRLISEYAFLSIGLEKNLLTTLRVKLSDKEIQGGLDEPWVEGIAYITDDELRTALSNTSKIEAGTHFISNCMLSRPIDQYKAVLLRMLNIYTLLTLVSPGEDATFIADLIPETQAAILTPPTPFENNITYASYDSGASLIQRLIDFDKTFRINAQLAEILNAPGISLETQAVGGLLAAGYGAALKVLMDMNKSANKMIADIERMTTIGLAVTGVGKFESSYLKCAAGIDFDFRYNPLNDLLNAAIDKVNAFLDEMSSALRRLMNEVICQMTCLQEALGLGGLKLSLPFCSLAVPPLVNLAPTLKELAKIGGLLKDVVLNRMKDQNVVRFAVTDMSSSFADVSNDCECEPLSGVFGMLASAVPVAQLAAGLVAKAPTLSGSGMVKAALPSLPKF